MVSSTMRTAWVGSASSAGGPRTRPSRMSKEPPWSGHTTRVARSRPSLRRACACVQMLSRGKTPSRVWQMRISRPPMRQLRMLPSGTSASFSAASNCGMTPCASELDIGLEYGHRLAADPDAAERVALEFELDLDPSGPVERGALDAAEAGALAVALEEAQVRQISPEQAVGVAAHRVLGDAERRAEHARFGQVVGGVRRQGEHEVTGRADLRRQRREPREIGFELLEGLEPD